ncbi:MAG: helix-turn-helix transcriptional regulator [Elusimicrobia bacterium]|nr:helix-turn-helix transcriptional regulator [Elusimicrobiota bacterium]
MAARGLNQSDVARLAHVSRQAVSLWFKFPEADIRTSHLLALSRGTGVSLDTLLTPLPSVDADAEAELLWDRLYADLLAFAAALTRGELKALARLAQECGLYRAERIVGNDTWSRYPEYRRLIRPERREQLDRLWRWETSRTSR